MLRALDLFCGAGGATRGLQLAGFHVTGVDRAPQPHYCGDAFVQADALTAPLDGYDLIWASPPCQAFTAYRRRPGHVRPVTSAIAALRARLEAAGAPFVIENVAGAPLRAPARLCGSSFGLAVRRHRYFETTFPLLQPACQHQTQPPQFPPATNRRNLRRTVEVGVWRIPLPVQQAAMGIDWMSREELSQAIPPAYSAYLGGWALRAIHA